MNNIFFIIIGILVLVAGVFIITLDNDFTSKCEAAGGFVTYTNNGDSICINKSSVIKF